MTRVEIEDGRIVADVPHRESPLIKQVPGAKWHQASLRWRLPLSWSSCLALRGVFGDKLTVGDALVEWAFAELHDRIDPALGWREVAVQPNYPARGHGGLYPHQVTAMEFMVAAGSALLGDEVGVGKTPTTVCAVEALNAWPLLVVAPKSMGRTWARELATWAGVEALVLEGSAAQRAKAFDGWLAMYNAGAVESAVVVSYDLLRSHSRLAPYGSIALSVKEKTPGLLNEIAWGAVVADEAHRAKDAKAKQTRALWAVGDKARHRFALTGTPIANNVGDLWAILRFLAPEEWPSRTAYLERYCNVSLNYWGGHEILGLRPDTEAEFRAIFEPRFLRRTKELILPHLPEIVYMRRDVEMAPRQAKAYKELAKGLVAALESGVLTVFSPLEQGMRLSQMASASVELGEDGESVRMCEPSPKLDVLLEVLEELGGLPCAVFAASRQLLDLAWARLSNAGIAASRIVGGMHPLERQDALDSYNKGEVDVILISLGAGAEGISLKRGSHEIFLDRSWSSVQNKQGEGRMHGTGRGDEGAARLTVIDLVASGTIEEHRADVLADKAAGLEELVQDRALLLAALRGSK